MEKVLLGAWWLPGARLPKLERRDQQGMLISRTIQENPREEQLIGRETGMGQWIIQPWSQSTEACRCGKFDPDGGGIHCVSLWPEPKTKVL